MKKVRKNQETKIIVKCVQDDGFSDIPYNGDNRTDQDILFCDVNNTEIETRHTKELLRAMFIGEIIEDISVLCKSMSIRKVSVNMDDEFRHVTGNTVFPIATTIVNQKDGDPLEWIYLFIKDEQLRETENDRQSMIIISRLYLIGRVQRFLIKDTIKPTFNSPFRSIEFSADALAKKNFYLISKEDFIQQHGFTTTLKSTTKSNSDSTIDMMTYHDSNMGIEPPLGDDEEATSPPVVVPSTQPSSFSSILQSPLSSDVLSNPLQRKNVFMFDNEPPKITESSYLMLRYNIKHLIIKKIDLFIYGDQTYERLFDNLKDRHTADVIIFHFLARCCCSCPLLTKWYIHMELGYLENRNCLSSADMTIASDRIQSKMLQMYKNRDLLNKNPSSNKIVTNLVDEIIQYLDSNVQYSFLIDCKCENCYYRLID